MDADPIALMYGGLEKLGPGDDASTLKVLRMLPATDFRLVVDAGCGSGRQTLALARSLDTEIHALDNFQPFLDELNDKARAVGVAQLVQTYCMDMRDIPHRFHDIDLLWSEGAAYNLGFTTALETWASALASDGLLVVSELSWLDVRASRRVADFWVRAYPSMASVEQNVAMAARAGYRTLATYTLPRDTWINGYYDTLGPRARSLLHHEDETVRTMAAENIEEIAIFDLAEQSYGYVFYVLQPC